MHFKLFFRTKKIKIRKHIQQTLVMNEIKPKQKKNPIKHLDTF